MLNEKWLYAFLSFLVVGLGQLVKGEGEKALQFILLFYFTLPAIFLFSLAISGWLFLITFGIGFVFAIMFWVYNIADAYKA